MKKLIIIFLTICIFVSGCSVNISFNDDSKDKSSVKEESFDDSYKYDNLIIEEIDTKYDNNSNNEVDENSNSSEITSDDLVNYMEGIELRVDDIVSKDDVSEKDENVLRNTFITITDFIFYDCEIKAKKFSDITDSCKEKILDIYIKIDSKIESRFPNYKEKIKNTSKKVYSNVIDGAKKLRDEIKNKYKDYVGEDKYNGTSELYEDSKQDIKDVYDVYKPYVEEGKEKAKSAYESAKEKLSEWYKNYKEKDSD